MQPTGPHPFEPGAAPVNHLLVSCGGRDKGLDEANARGRTFVCMEGHWKIKPVLQR